MISEHNKYVLARWLVRNHAYITKTDSFGNVYIKVYKNGRCDDEVHMLGREFQVLWTVASHCNGFAITPGVYMKIEEEAKNDTTV